MAQLVRDVNSLKSSLGGVLVPTMGALHAGHGALIESGAREAAARGGVPVVVSVFVNPRQFDEASDFERYPRGLEEDVERAARSGATYVFAPSVETVYPPGDDRGAPELPDVATRPGLEDRFRPGHFSGVYQVVRNLFELTRPVAAVFGEKDWQQLQVVRALVEMEGLPVEIIAGETVREADGLALSSRNKHLSDEDREAALSIPRALEAGRRESRPVDAEAAMRGVLREGGVETEYAVVREARTLREIDARSAEARPMRALVAARVGSTRLIDNMAWPGR